MAKLEVEKDFSWIDYHTNRARLHKALNPIAFARKDFADEFYSYPAQVTQGEVNTINRMTNVFLRAVSVVVSNYFKDERMSSRLPLSRSVRTELESLDQSVPYSPKFMRPDFLYAENGTPMICEVNGRYPFNTFFLASYANNAFPRVFPKLSPMSGLSELTKALSQVVSKPYAVFKKEEEGYDIHFFLLESPSSSFHPLDGLEKALVQGDNPIVLELHHDEIKDNLKSIVERVKIRNDIVNDPRTVFIACDKRALSIITDQSIMEDYMDSSDLNIIKKHVIKTYVPSVQRQVRQHALKNKGQWIAKEGLSGKSEGIVLGDNTISRVWAARLDDPDYVVQKRLKQQKFKLWDPEFWSFKEFNLAGTIPTINGRSFGPGVYRIFTLDEIDHFGFAQPMLVK